MQKYLISFFMLFSLPIMALEGFYFDHKDWEIACDNTGTCRMAGYPPEEVETPVSIYFERKAGESAVLGMAKIELEEGQASLSLWLDNQSLGQLKKVRDSDEFHLTSDQTEKVLAALSKSTVIEMRSPKGRWKISDKGATAVMLKMDEFQQRLNTPTALVRKGNSTLAVLAAEPLPKVKLLDPIKGNPAFVEETIWEENPRYAPLLSLLKSQVKADECDSLGLGGNAITVQPLSAERKLIGSLCNMGAYNSVSLYVVADNREKEAYWHSVGYNGFDKGTLLGMYKDRGLGDCWSGEEAVWNGETFVKSREWRTGQCRGFAGGAWTLPTFVADVIEQK